MAISITKPTRTPQFNGSSFLASSLGFTTGNTFRPPFSILTNFDSIRDNIRNILFFRKGEYPDDVDFGVGLQDYLFDQEGPQFNLILSQEIRRQIGKYEKKATIQQLNVYTPAWADDSVMVDLTLIISGSLFSAAASPGGTFTLQPGKPS